MNEAVPKGAELRVWLGYGGMCLGAFMALLDIQVVASSIADIAGAMSSTLDEASWIQTSYLIAEIIMIPLTGWFTQLLSLRILFVCSASLFTLASVGCALSGSLEVLIAWRVVQGFVGGAMIPVIFSSSYAMFPPHQQQRALIAAGCVSMLGPTLGPTLGGWLTQTFAWEWIFLVNIPVGIATAWVTLRFLAKERPDWSHLKDADMLSLVCLALSLGCGQYLLEEAPSVDWWDSREMRLLLAISLVCGCAFVLRTLSLARPLVDLRVFRYRRFTIGCIASWVFGISFYSLQFLVPLQLVEMRHFNSMQIGIVLMISGASQLAAAPFASIADQRLSERITLTFGVIIAAFSAWWMSNLTSEFGYADLAPGLFLRGFSTMFLFLPLSAMALSEVPPAELHHASGLFNLVRNFGGAVGISCLTTVHDLRFDLHYTRLREATSGDWLAGSSEVQQWAGNAGELALSQTQGYALLVQNAQRQASMIAFNDLWLITMASMLLLLLILPLMNHRRSGAAVRAH